MTTFSSTHVPGTIIVGDQAWVIPAVLLGLAGVLLAFWLNRRRIRQLAGGPWLRIVGWLLLVACLVHPLWSSARPRRGANVLAVVTDISRSHLVSAYGDDRTRAVEVSEALQSGEDAEAGGWLHRLSQDFELRRYVASDRLRRVRRYAGLEFDGVASHLETSLQQLAQRFEGQPLAGIVLLSDGNATDLSGDVTALSGIPPIFPVVLPSGEELPDVSIGTAVTTQSAFDDAPVSISVQASVSGAPGSLVQYTLFDENGVALESRTQPAAEDDRPVRFQHRPETAGTVFYTVRTTLLSPEGEEQQEEATVANNERLIAVDRGSVPRRILYVSGRPNWEFKFLRRAIQTDPLIELVGLIRIAKKEAKFDFRGRDGESSNSIFRGFEQSEQEIVEEYDEPVLVRIGTRNDEELVTGFPESPEELFGYDAIILDDIEADFFLADQQKLIYDFVARRGGGFLMMGGQESFRQGEYDRTPVGKLLPVDLSRSTPVPQQPVRMTLTRDGWLQPWVRIRSDESAEETQRSRMPAFTTLNSTAFVRPGAVVMAEVEDAQQNRWPALVVQRFGRGRSAALCVGDFWRWRLREGLNALMDDGPSRGGIGRSGPIVAPGGDAEDDLSDHARACRQMIRWLVADVPQRLDVQVAPAPESGFGAVRISVRVKGRDFADRENADVRIVVTAPDGKRVELTGEPSDDDSGLFDAIVSAPAAGPWRAAATATLIGEDDVEPLTAETGWASQPDQQEMQSVEVNTEWLKSVAAQTGGQTIDLTDVDEIPDLLNATDVPVVEYWSWPLWHQWWVLAAAVGCLVTDWTLRRRRGLP